LRDTSPAAASLPLFDKTGKSGYGARRTGPFTPE